MSSRRHDRPIFAHLIVTTYVRNINSIKCEHVVLTSRRGRERSWPGRVGHGSCSRKQRRCGCPWPLLMRIKRSFLCSMAWRRVQMIVQQRSRNKRRSKNVNKNLLSFVTWRRKHDKTRFNSVTILSTWFDLICTTIRASKMREARATFRHHPRHDHDFSLYF